MQIVCLATQLAQKFMAVSGWIQPGKNVNASVLFLQLLLGRTESGAPVQASGRLLHLQMHCR